MFGSPILPLVTITDIADAVPIAAALAEGGIKLIEIAMRTEQALSAIETIRHHLPDLSVGAGTVVNPDCVQRAASAGAQFLVSPGCTDALLSAAQASGLPFLPGVSTTSEVLAAIEAGMTHLKFFPASVCGGPGLLRQWSAVVPEASFCPTGGISPGNARDYLALSNVFAVGGSWLVPPSVVASKTWIEITVNARRALALTVKP
ncbi:MAG: ketohydroxyglutarate aldolase [Lysobacteraceae bacterium]|nr:MAG: ketohydroxyglutarate aldolase [Xanthomonadaceae bacterium]